MGSSIRESLRRKGTPGPAPAPKFRAPDVTYSSQPPIGPGSIIIGIIMIAVLVWCIWGATAFAYHVVFGWPEPAKVAVAAQLPKQGAEPQLPVKDLKSTETLPPSTPKVIDHSGSASYQKEWYMVRALVSQSGGLCASVAYVEPQLDGSFKAVCKAWKGTNKYTGWIIDPDARTVVPFNAP